MPTKKAPSSKKKSLLRQKLGPLETWVWMAIIGGLALLYYLYSSKSSSSSSGTTSASGVPDFIIQNQYPATVGSGGGATGGGGPGGGGPGGGGGKKGGFNPNNGYTEVSLAQAKADKKLGATIYHINRHHNGFAIARPLVRAAGPFYVSNEWLKKHHHNKPPSHKPGHKPPVPHHHKHKAPPPPRPTPPPPNKPPPPGPKGGPPPNAGHHGQGRHPGPAHHGRAPGKHPIRKRVA